MISGISDNTVVDNTVVCVRDVSVSVEGLSRSQSLPSATALESSGRQDQNLRLSVP